MSRALAVAALFIVLAVACIGDEKPLEDSGAATGSPSAVPTQPTTPTRTPTPTPTATPSPTLEQGQGVVVGGVVILRAGPTSDADSLGHANEGTVVTIVGEERGENWIVGDQTWPMAIQDWTNVWYRLDNGSYIYSAFVFVPQDGEASPLQYQRTPNRYVLVDRPSQTAYAMAGDLPVRRMSVSTGKRGFETPSGEHRVYGDGRIAVETMTAQQAGFDQSIRYEVKRVLFTQYFTMGGDALHLNYWQPYSVFGRAPSSHGCVGLLLADAQFLWLFADPQTPVVIR